MAETIKSSGSCLCGSVTITAQDMETDVGACHCDTCRKWGGGPLLAVNCKNNVTITGEEHISVYDSSEWADRSFCSKCGSHLFWRLKDKSEYIVSAGLFDAESQMKLDHQVFIDQKPTYYSFSEQTRNMTGQEVFEYFGGG